MPYISAKTNISITPGKETALKDKLGKAISLLPGKSEAWLMLSFEEDCQLYYKGENDDPIAYVEVKQFGSADKESYENLTAEISKILKEVLGINPENVYVNYQESSIWGWNGKNL
ncbi:MAG: hypothetical protein LBU32_26635 [Clostridiales bacterium]|jgi:phenylpyruvate tautomerase PptA (4-oxalocrotonate tautomerase family)|nr:hypothetical protein [Clostridiales bacterium]